MPRVAVLFDNSVRPETTGFYVRRAVGQVAEVEHFLPRDFAALERGDHGRFDLYLAVDDGLDYRLPRTLRPLAFWAIDTHVSFAQVSAKAAECDLVFAAQRDGAERLRESGIASAIWLPLACDPEIHRPHPVPRRYDIGFIGHIFPGPRENLLRTLQERHPNSFVGQRYLHEMAEVYSACRIAFNRSLVNDVNMRVFEVLACGPLLVTNALGDNGQDELFQSGKHLVSYQDERELMERIDWHLRHDRERERIAAEGRREAVARHTYRHRVETILAEAERQKRTSVAVSAASSEKDRSYYDFDRPDVLALIPSQARSVLDIGCGSGRLGESLKRRQPARVVGIELDPDAAQRAAKRLDDVRRMNLEEDVADFAAGQFDCVVCADVLEHLRHPERLLKKIREWLVPQGCLVASIPNIRHHSVLTSLLAGNFTYEPAGLLDETHLRFFTRREIEKLLFRAGFEIQELKSIVGPGDAERIEAARQGEVRAGRLSIRGLDPSEAAEFHTYQFLVRATPRRSKASSALVSSIRPDAARQKLANRHPWPASSPGLSIGDHDVGWVGDGARAVLEHAVRPDMRCLVELGTWLGASARLMATRAPDSLIVCVDHWKGSPEHQNRNEFRELLPRLFEAFQTSCWDLRDRLVPLRMTTLEGLRAIADAGLDPDLIYFDTDHSTAAVTAEIELARQLFPRARLIGDDYSAPEVAAAVDGYARRCGGTVIAHGTNWRGWELRFRDDARETPRDHGLTSIILATHNQWDYTRLCLESIRFRTDEPYELIVVDNGSRDGTPAFLRGCSDVRLIENAGNRGFPAAVNQGLAIAQGKQILLLNNDTVVTTGWLRRMLDALRSSSDVGLVGPVSNNVSGPQRIPVEYEQLADLDGFAWDWGKIHSGRVADIDRLVGFCLLIDRRVVETIGPLDERFGIGNFEDDDYCRRALEAGFRCVVAEDSFVHHFGGRTFAGSGVDYGRLLAENGRKYQEKWQTPNRTAAVPLDSTNSSTKEGRGRPRLSLCMIVRDNERTIVPCLDSIRPWVDEMIVVDTGSQDRTPDLCRELGARVHHFPWCDDFSAARNESLRHAAGEWIFWMDSDDTIPEDCGRRLRALADGPHEDQLLGYVMQVHCPSPNEDGTEDVTVVDHVKLFRSRPDLRFEHRIHEQILPAIRRAGGDVAFTDVFVVHSGSDHTSEGKERKLVRDFRLLELDAAERPDHPFVLFNLGMTYADARRYDEAIDALRRCLAVAQPGESQVRKCYALLVGALSQTDREEEAFAACGEGLELFPDDKELRFREGILHHRFGRLSDAERSYLSVLCETSERHFSSADAAIAGIKTRHNLAIVYEDMARWEDAEAQWKAILDENADYRAAWRGWGELTLRTRRFQDARRIVDEMSTRPAMANDAQVLKARLWEAEGDLASARRILESVLSDGPDDSIVLRELCRLLFERFQVSDALPYLERLLSLEPDDAATHHNLATVHVHGGRADRAVPCYLRSLQLRPRSASTALELGRALQHCGRPDEALRAWREGLRWCPDSDELKAVLRNAVDE